MNSQGTTIHSLFEKQVQNSPKTLAARDGKQTISYDQLNQKANRLAHYLLSKGLKPDTPVAFCLERSFDCLIAMLAILKAGGAYLPLDEEHPTERLLFILNNSKAPFLILKSSLAKQFSAYEGIVLALEDEEQTINQQPKHNPNVPVLSSNLAYIIYTSGSTGTPKGVLIEHETVIHYCHWYALYCDLKPKQIIDFSSKHTFDMAVSVSIVPLMLGLTLVLCTDAIKKNVRHYLQHLKKSKTHLIKTTPSFFRLLIQEARTQFIALPHLKRLILGGENLPAHDCAAWLDLYPHHILHNEYGPTETTVAVSQFKITCDTVKNLNTNVPIGYLGSTMQAIIMNEQGSPLPPGEIGELHIGGACLARGYLNQPNLTQQQFIYTSEQLRLYKTGDLCSISPTGLLEYFGRRDAQIKIRGFRIEPAEIEQHLSTYPSIEHVFVLAQKDSLNESCLVAYYTLKNKATNPTNKQLRTHLHNRVPEYMIPTAFLAVDNIPLNANGKLDTTLLPLPQLVASQPYREASTALEKTLLTIWEEELGVHHLGIDDDFFELGGHSLSAARIISKITRVLNKEVSLAEFYQTGTIASLADLIGSIKKQGRSKAFKKIAQQLTQIPLCNFQLMLWLSNTFEPKAKKINITLRKRFNGQLDKVALEFAFHALLSTQEVLRFRVQRFKPLQLLQKNAAFKLIEVHLNDLLAEEAESILDNSMDQLKNFYPWPKDAALIKAKLFHLPNQIDELQISMPHIISDDFSPHIVLSNLSRFYLQHKNKKFHFKLPANNKPYKDYVLHELEKMQQNLDKDTAFWEYYLKDAGLYTIPESYIQQDMRNRAYSSYIKLSEQTLDTLKNFCSKQHLSIKDGLCAAVTMALHKCITIKQYHTPFIYVNIIKSTRTKEDYDNTIGCFLRLEPVKIALHEESTLSSLAQEIHQSTLDTSSYQQCPDLIKMACLSNFKQKKSLIKEFVTHVLIAFYAQIFSFSSLHQKILQVCALRLNSLQRCNDFLININVHKDFITPQTSPDPLFRLETIEMTPAQQDLLTLNNIFDVCFTRDEQGMPNLVISSNLKAEFRELIAQEIVRILNAPSLATCLELCSSEVEPN